MDQAAEPVEASPVSVAKDPPKRVFKVSPRAFGRTGERADWMDKTKSFKVTSAG